MTKREIELKARRRSALSQHLSRLNSAPDAQSLSQSYALPLKEVEAAIRSMNYA